jgi:hypothetical protein
METSNLQLPVQVAGRVDVGRLLREAEQIDNFLKQAAIREPGTSMKLPKTSRLMDDFVSSNKLNLLHEVDRTKILNFLVMVKAKAPVLHMSFGVDPSPSFTQRLMAWLRQEVHPLALVQVGLQPNIGAGCIIRTTNKYFDFSLREHFKKQRPLLVQKLHIDAQAKAAPAPAPEVGLQPSDSDRQQLATAEAQLQQQVASAVAAIHPTAPADAPHHEAKKVEVVRG